MNHLRTLSLLLLLSSAMVSKANQVNDTLSTPYGDKIIVTYELVQKGNQFEVRFKEVRKKLGTENKRTYKDLAEVKVMFFDHIGFSDVTFKGLPPGVLMIPPGITYTKSEDGYIDLDDQPTLVFECKSTDATIGLNIPMFLVHYEKKHRYKIFAKCDDLVIEAKPAPNSQQSSTGKDNGGASVMPLLQEEALSDVDSDALTSLQYIAEELSKTEKLPFSDMLVQQVENLKILKFKVQNKEIASKIDEIISEFESKKADLEAKAAEEAKRQQEAENRKMDSTAFAQCTTITDYEAYIKAHPNGAYLAEAQEMKTQLEEEAATQAAKEKRRKIWMIVGGVLLGILIFIGNQVLQNFRNMKMQRNMMQMQQNAANQAQNMAKKKVQGEVRKQTGKMAGQVKKTSKDAINQSVGKIKPGKPNGNNNRVSI